MRLVLGQELDFTCESMSIPNSAMTLARSERNGPQRLTHRDNHLGYLLEVCMSQRGVE
jgi:hypothetical protein